MCRRLPGSLSFEPAKTEPVRAELQGLGNRDAQMDLSPVQFVVGEHDTLGGEERFRAHTYRLSSQAKEILSCLTGHCQVIGEDECGVEWEIDVADVSTLFVKTEEIG